MVSSNLFQPASRKKLRARIAIDGPAGSGKTYTALRFAFALGQRVAVIDTEHRSAAKYHGEQPDGVPWRFDVCELEYYAPSTYTQMIREAGRADYEVLIIDSLSHAWEGTGGALDMVDRKSSQGGNSFTAWKDVTPLHREMVESILACPCHVIVTMRTKMEYVLEEEVNRNGRKIQVPKKVGMAPIQRQGVEYEFDVVADMDLDHLLKISKTRCPAMDGISAMKPGASFLIPLVTWLGSGETECVSPAADQDGAKQPAPRSLRLSGRSSASNQRSEYVANLTDPCSEVLANQVKAMAQRAQIPPEAFAAVLARRGAKRVLDLSIEQAQELLGKLEAKVLETEAPFCDATGGRQ